MSLEHIFYLSQIIAALALVASLLFVALEVRNSNRESRHRAGEEAYQKFREVQLEVAKLSHELGESTESMAGDLLGYPGIQAAWSVRKTYFHPKFRVHVDTKIEATPSSSTSVLPYEHPGRA
jgi:hypothetical protein